MSYETKAGVAVSCSFLCLVGVVLTSKLWEGQPANADTTPESQQSAEVVGAKALPVNGAMAPESTLPNLQPPPTGENVLQQVKGPEAARPRLNVEALFAKPGDPFQQSPLIVAEAPKDPAGGPNAVVPNFNSQPPAPPSLANQPASSAVPALPLAAAEAGIADPKKASDPKPADETGFAAMAAELRKKAAGGETIGNGVVDMAPKAGQPAVAVIPEVKVSPPPGVDAALLAAQKKAQEEAAALNGVLDPKSDPKNVAAASADKDDVSQQLEKQKSLEQAAAKDPAKEVAAAAEAAFAASQRPAKDGAANLKDPVNNGFDTLTGQSKPAALASGQQQINNGAAIVNNAVNNVPNFSIEAQNAGKGPQGVGGAPVVIPAMGAVAGTNQPQLPANGIDGYPGRTETASADTGSRPNAGAVLGAPTSPQPRNTPPDDQFAQLRGNQTPPPNSGPPPVGTRADASVPAMAVKVPIAAQQDNWDDDQFSSRPGDTYQSLAQEKYGSARYGQALMLYNRDYPLATSATQRNPETIVAGQTIYVPPARILQRQYGSVIPDQSAAASPPLGNRAPAPTLPAVTAATPLPEKRYRVPGGGAMFLTIARTKLGDENRWPEIYRLNPSFEPTNLVPGGTVLRIPGDAKLDPADIPVAQ
jgi:hypothetical protein